MRIILLSLTVLFILSSCGKHKPELPFEQLETPTPPDYSKAAYWSALPTTKDAADRTPIPTLEDLQEISDVDVFFLHPTIYTGDKGEELWNAPVNDPEHNEKVDESTILNQASVFNGAGKIYAPRYRQAHLHSYSTTDKKSAAKAFELAYQDLKKAFEYYLENYNKGRPIIIASHSQGTTHSKRLVKEFFDGKPLQEQLVAAYLVGIPVLKTHFDKIPVCETPHQTGCYVSWRTYRTGYLPPFSPGDSVTVVNPLSWTTDTTFVHKSNNKGAVLRKFNKITPMIADAKIHQGVLWTDKPKFPGSFLFNTPNYHVADYNFYYVNVRENAMLRAKTFLERK